MLHTLLYLHKTRHALTNKLVLSVKYVHNFLELEPVLRMTSPSSFEKGFSSIGAKIVFLRQGFRIDSHLTLTSLSLHKLHTDV